ncbi:MAG: hypothetical protein HFJ35_02415 [Clostridia bacterium]|nr:hypothetical protein [Clostridia bacterium]
MADNVINFNTVRNSKMLDGLNLTEVGNINITVFREEASNYATYHILPDRKELIPIVNLLDDTLTNNSFKLSKELKVNNL